jgi:predicted ferric reductase
VTSNTTNAAWRSTTRTLSGPRPQPWIANVLALLMGVGLGVAATLAISVESLSLLNAPGGWFDAGARLCAMTGTYLLLVMVLLMARIPGLERAVGQDRLTRWHRRIGGWPVALIAAHVILVTLGYAAAAHTGIAHQVSTFLSSYNGMVLALIGFIVLVGATLTSIPVVRRLMNYEHWWLVHVTLYVALALSFQHQMSTGIMFIGHPLATLFWRSAWIVTTIILIYARILVPLWRNLYHRLSVHSVTLVAPGVTAVTLRGHHLEKLGASGGQFFQWRFMTPSLWWHSHPYSLSALPRPPYVRLTVKDLGDHSSSLENLRPGTRVLIEGPYGVLTHHHRSTGSVVLIGAGVGITPLRSILDDLPSNVPVTMIIRAGATEEVIHGDELQRLITDRGGQFHVVTGPRGSTLFDSSTIYHLAPNITQSDLYICGPESFADLVVQAAYHLGLNDTQIHNESFSWW